MSYQFNEIITKNRCWPQAKRSLSTLPSFLAGNRTWSIANHDSPPLQNTRPQIALCKWWKGPAKFAHPFESRCDTNVFAWHKQIRCQLALTWSQKYSNQVAALPGGTVETLLRFHGSKPLSSACCGCKPKQSSRKSEGLPCQTEYHPCWMAGTVFLTYPHQPQAVDARHNKGKNWLVVNFAAWSSKFQTLESLTQQQGTGWNC